MPIIWGNKDAAGNPIRSDTSLPENRTILESTAKITPLESGPTGETYLKQSGTKRIGVGGIELPPSGNMTFTRTPEAPANLSMPPDPTRPTARLEPQ